ncbi:MAG: porin, partial [Gammaproteobacteria bacterium]
GTVTGSVVTSVGSSSITDRDQWLGLAGGFGQVRIGTISTVYKSHGAMVDPLYRTSLQGRDRGLQLARLQSGAGEEIQGRATNTIRFDSANYNGLKVGATYTLDNNETDGEDDNPYGIGASYENGGILAFADYITNDGGSSNAAGDLTAWKVGGKFTMNAFAIMGQYEDLSNDNTGTSDFTQWHVGGTYTMGNNLIYAAYGANNQDPAAGNDVDTDAYTIALMHSLSKRTKVYAGYNNQDNDGGEPGVAADLDRDQWSLGMKHLF